MGKKRIGLYFGTFNPIHIGHLIIANYVVEFSELDEVWFVVTPHNPHKKKKSLLEDYHRLAMVEMAIEEYPRLKASNVEFNLPQPNYTVNTLAVLEEKYPSYHFSLIMGEDNLESLHRWKNYRVILERHKIYVYPRVYGDFEKKEVPAVLQEFPNAIIKVDAPIMELSSTFIRNAIETKRDIRAMLPRKVWEYIELMNFYKLKPTLK